MNATLNSGGNDYSSRGGLGFRATAPLAFAAAPARGRVSTFLSGVSQDLCDPWLTPCLADGGLIPAIPSPIIKLQTQRRTSVSMRRWPGKRRSLPPMAVQRRRTITLGDVPSLRQ
jgi:hypothetical protein